MAINGINSFSASYFNYQSSINNLRLAQAFTKNPKLNSVASNSLNTSYRNNTMNSQVGFVKDYSSSMTNLMNAANSLKSTNSSGVMNDMVVSSSDNAVATATEKLTVRNAKDIDLNVLQLAQSQVNVSDGVKASDMAQTDINFTVGNEQNSVKINVSAVDQNGNARSNLQMLQEAAGQINRNGSPVKASVIQKDGVASLQLEGSSTGAAHSFQVTGQLGAAAGVDKVQTEAANAKYSVTTDGKTTQHESYSNQITFDSTRIEVNLKGVGNTKIRADVDTEKVASSINNLVDAYNSSLKLLNDNHGRGSGVERQLRNMLSGLGSDQSLKQLGISVQKDGTLAFDKKTFTKNMDENPSWTKRAISGAGGLADNAFSKASSGLNTSSNSLINGNVTNSRSQSQAATNPYNVFRMYSKSGIYTMNNYNAVGMMLNYLI